MTSERDKIARLQLPTKAKTLDSRLRMSGMTKEGYYYRSFPLRRLPGERKGQEWRGVGQQKGDLARF